MSSAISDLRTSVENIGNTYVAISSLESKVDEAITGIKNAASNTYANSTMFSAIGSAL